MMARQIHRRRFLQAGAMLAVWFVVGGAKPSPKPHPSHPPKPTKPPKPTPTPSPTPVPTPSPTPTPAPVSGSVFQPGVFSPQVFAV